MQEAGTISRDKNRPLEAAVMQGAIELLANQAPNDQVAQIAGWIKDRLEYGFMYADRLGQPHITNYNKDSGGVTLAFVDDRDPGLQWYPELRRLPRYEPAMRTMTMPIETAASSLILAGVILHEGVHAYDFDNPEHAAKAQKLLPGASRDEAIHLLSEVNAFTLEGQFLEAMLGEPFAHYLQTEVDAASQNAELEEKGVHIEIGVDRDRVEQAVGEHVSFVSKRAGEFCLDLMGMAIPLHVGYRAIDQVCELHDVSEDGRIEMKVFGLNHGEYFY